MGIAPAMVKLLMREGKREEYTGNVLTIGRQCVYVNTTRDLQNCAEKMGFQLNTNTEISLQNEKDKNNNITDSVLFISLGFDNIDSLDISDYEQCTILHDLNTDVPAKLYNKYDLIFDSGSSEHIFNLPKVLENYYKMLKVGGRLIHGLPSSNHVDHGFYMFSPTLLWDYYSANNWEIKDSIFIRYPIRHDKELWDIYSYTPGCLDRFSYGRVGKGLYGIYFVAKKTDKSTYNASVQQRQCLKSWKGALDLENTKFQGNNSWKKKMQSAIPEKLKPISYFLYDYISAKIPLRFNLKRIGRY